MEAGRSRREFIKVASAAGLGGTLGLGVLVGASSAYADLILVNGRFHTLQKMKPTAAAVAVKDGQFLAVGAAKDVLASKGQRTLSFFWSRSTSVICGLRPSSMPSGRAKR